MSRFLILLGQYDSTWNVLAQLTDGTTIPLSNYHELLFDGTNFGDNIFLGTYQDSIHVLDSTGAHACKNVSGVFTHVHNAKFLTNTTYALDGAASANLPVPTGSCPLQLTWTNVSSVATSNTKFFSYDGNIDATPLANVTFKAAEGGSTTTWKDANGLLNALSLAAQSASTTHTFYLAFSFLPSTLGWKIGKVKLTFNYI